MEFSFDFDAWATLAHSDAEAFERLRRNTIDEALKRIKGNQPRLKGLQFRIDMERRRAGTPTKSYQRLSGLMWRSFDAMNEAVHSRTPAPSSVPAAKSATVIQLSDRNAKAIAPQGTPEAR